MTAPSPPREALSLLGEVHREKRTGTLTLTLEGEGAGSSLAVRDGEIVGFWARGGPPPEPPPSLDESTTRKLERVLAEVGLAPPGPDRPARVPPRPGGADLRERLLSLLTAPGMTAHFREPAPPEVGTVPVVADTAPLILEAARRLDSAEPVRPATRPEASEPGAEAHGDPAREDERLPRRREVLELFESLPHLNHFEILGLRPGCTEAEVRRAHVRLVKRYHPDSQQESGMEDLQGLLEAIFMRVGEAWEVLGEKESRDAYEARLGPGDPHPPPARPGAQGRGPEPAEGATSEDTLRQAQELLDEARYWDAIRLLESAAPRLTPQRHQHRGRILLARAYGHNPKWLHRAEETLHSVVRDDPAHAEAHYELGLLYKRGGLNARAKAMFRKAVQLQPDHHQAAAETGTNAPAPTGRFLRRLFGGGKGTR